jgi:hypothetical protein
MVPYNERPPYLTTPAPRTPYKPTEAVYWLKMRANWCDWNSVSLAFRHLYRGISNGTLGSVLAHRLTTAKAEKAAWKPES